MCEELFWAGKRILHRLVRNSPKRYEIALVWRLWYLFLNTAAFNIRVSLLNSSRMTEITKNIGSAGCLWGPVGNKRWIFLYYCCESDLIARIDLRSKLCKKWYVFSLSYHWFNVTPFWKYAKSLHVKLRKETSRKPRSYETNLHSVPKTVIT